MSLVNSYRSYAWKDSQTSTTGIVQLYKVQEISSTLFEWMMDLMKRNMKTLYVIVMSDFFASLDLF